MQYYTENIPDNMRRPQHDLVIQFGTQILNTPTSINEATPSVYSAAFFGVYGLNQSISLLIHKPALTTTLSFNAYAGDAMDIVTVTATVKHTSASTSAAHDVFAIFPLSSDFHIVEGTLAFTPITNYTLALNLSLTNAFTYGLFGNSSSDLNVTLYLSFLGLKSTLSATFHVIVDEHA
jgi:hypothetical protein